MKALPLAAATALTIGTFALTTVTAPTPAKADPGYDCIASGGIWVMLESSGSCGHGSTGMELTSSAGFNPIRKGSSGMVCQIAGYPEDSVAETVCKNGWTAKEEYLQIWWYIGNEWIYADLGADEPNPAGLKAYAWIFGETGKVKPTYTPQSPSPAPSTPAPSTPAPSTPAPSTPAPSTPAPSTPAPSTPAPSTPAPSTPAPSTPTPARTTPTRPTQPKLPATGGEPLTGLLTALGAAFVGLTFVKGARR